MKACAGRGQAYSHAVPAMRVPFHACAVSTCRPVRFRGHRRLAAAATRSRCTATTRSRAIRRRSGRWPARSSPPTSATTPCRCSIPRSPARPAGWPVGFNPVELEGPAPLVGRSRRAGSCYVNLSFAVAGSGSGPHGVHGLGDQPGYVRQARRRDRARGRPGPGRSPTRATTRCRPTGARFTSPTTTRSGWRRQQRRFEPGGASTSSQHGGAPAAAAVPGRPRCAAVGATGSTLYATCGPRRDGGGRPVAIPRCPCGGSRCRAASAGTTGCQRCPYALAVAPDGTVWVSSLGPNNGSAGRGSVDVFDPAARRRGASTPIRRLLHARAARSSRRSTDCRPCPAATGALFPSRSGPGDRRAVYCAGRPGEAPVGGCRAAAARAGASA